MFHVKQENDSKPVDKHSIYSVVLSTLVYTNLENEDKFPFINILIHRLSTVTQIYRYYLIFMSDV